jgi:hypothetical protein
MLANAQRVRQDKIAANRFVIFATPKLQKSLIKLTISIVSFSIVSLDFLEHINIDFKHSKLFSHPEVM